MELEPVGVVILEVRVHFVEKLAIVRSLHVEPENRWRRRSSRARDREFYPITNRWILCLTGAPNVARFNRMRHQHESSCVHNPHNSCALHFEGFIVRAVLFGLLRHEPNIGHTAHRARIECAVLLARVNGCLIDPRIGAIRNHSLRILCLARAVPHLAALANHRRHGCVDDDIARHMEIRDALVAINHCDRGTRSVCSSDVRFDH